MSSSVWNLNDAARAADAAADVASEPEATAGRRHRRWMAVLLMLGFLVYELTSDAVLGTVIASLKFGFDDFRSAFWLWRTDPDRRRGRASAAYYLAAGLFRIGAVTFLVGGVILFFMVFGVLARIPVRLNVDVIGSLVGTCILELMITLFLSGVIAFCASLLCRGGSRRIWIDHAVHRARREGLFPPPYVGANRGYPIAVGSMFTMVVLLTALAGMFITHVLDPLFRGFPRVVHAVILVGIIIGLIGSAFSLLQMIGASIANRPDDCWPLDEVLAGGRSPVETPDANPWRNEFT